LEERQGFDGLGPETRRCRAIFRRAAERSVKIDRGVQPLLRRDGAGVLRLHQQLLRIDNEAEIRFPFDELKPRQTGGRASLFDDLIEQRLARPGFLDAVSASSASPRAVSSARR
jgi:hypothetical protein